MKIRICIAVRKHLDCCEIQVSGVTENMEAQVLSVTENRGTGVKCDLKYRGTGMRLN